MSERSIGRRTSRARTTDSMDTKNKSRLAALAPGENIKEKRVRILISILDKLLYHRPNVASHCLWIYLSVWSIIPACMTKYYL